MFKLDLHIALICTLVAAVVLLLQTFWTFEKTAHLSDFTKACVSAVVIVFLVGIAWSPVSTEFHKTHFTADEAAFLEVLKAQTEPRCMVRIGCPADSERVCVVAERFLDLFKEAGWIVEGDSVQRLPIAESEAGILLRLHGTETIHPTPGRVVEGDSVQRRLLGTGILPTYRRSGLAALQSPSLITILNAFAEVGETADLRADEGMPSGIVAIHFGYSPIAP